MILWKFDNVKMGEVLSKYDLAVFKRAKGVRKRFNSPIMAIKLLKNKDLISFKTEQMNQLHKSLFIFYSTYTPVLELIL